MCVFDCRDIASLINKLRNQIFCQRGFATARPTGKSNDKAMPRGA
jgi:hypothetical protein